MPVRGIHCFGDNFGVGKYLFWCRSRICISKRNAGFFNQIKALQYGSVPIPKSEAAFGTSGLRLPCPLQICNPPCMVCCRTRCFLSDSKNIPNIFRKPVIIFHFNRLQMEREQGQREKTGIKSNVSIQALAYTCVRTEQSI